MIDWKRIDELRSQVGPDDLPGLLAEFMTEMEQGLAELSLDEPAPKIAANLHFLRGSALNIGLRQLAALCQNYEDAANRGNPPTGAPERLRASYRTAKSALLQGYATR
ncbi:MAG: Hpt domain-containing protein [Rhodobacteraceae bacterium]|nr:Hpt domain-containing protein [Paracoccaceae bacterium]